MCFLHVQGSQSVLKSCHHCTLRLREKAGLPHLATLELWGEVLLPDMVHERDHREGHLYRT